MGAPPKKLHLITERLVAMPIRVRRGSRCDDRTPEQLHREWLADDFDRHDARRH